MKALELLKELKESRDFDGNLEYKIDKAIEELEYLPKKIAGLNEYVKIATYYLEFYRCSCGALGRVGYLCSNEDCTEE